MTRLILALTLVPALSTAAFAEDWLTPKEFEARVSGKVTQALNLDGSPFGTEYFTTDGKVIWQYYGETQCLTGTRKARGSAVCYAYEGGIVNCMRYRMDGDRLVGVDANPGGSQGEPVVVVVTDAAPPACSG